MPRNLDHSDHLGSAAVEEWVCRQNIARLRAHLSNGFARPELLSALLFAEERRLRQLTGEEPLDL